MVAGRPRLVIQSNRQLTISPQPVRLTCTTTASQGQPPAPGIISHKTPLSTNVEQARTKLILLGWIRQSRRHKPSHGHFRTGPTFF